MIAVSYVVKCHGKLQLERVMRGFDDPETNETERRYAGVIREAVEAAIAEIERCKKLQIALSGPQLSKLAGDAAREALKQAGEH